MEDKVNVKVTHHQHVPQSGLLLLLEEERHTDVTFYVSGMPVHAHRAVVASQSDYFDRLLFGQMKESQSAEIVLKETPLEPFRVLLRYMYSGLVATTMTVETTLELLYLVDKYGFELLRESLEVVLCDAVSLSNVLQLFFNAQAVNATTLRRHCESLIDANAQALLAEDAILSLPWENLKYLIMRDSFVIDEIQVFHAVCRWKQHNEASTGELAELLRCVRISEIPKEEVIHVVAPTGMYSTSSLYKLLEGQQQKALPCSSPTRGRLPERNLLASDGARLKSWTNFDVDVLPVKFPEPKGLADLTFHLNIEATHRPSTIVVQLDDLYLVNELRLEGYSGARRWEREAGEKQPFCYYVEVAKDLSNWVTVVNHSNLRCYSTQQLYFPKQAVRFIRLIITRGHEMYTIQLHSFSYDSEVLTKYKFRENGMLAPLTPIEPKYSQYVCNSKEGLRCFVNFNQPYSISLMRFSLLGIEEAPKAQLTVCVSTQNRPKSYMRVASLSSHLLSAPITVSFEERPVSIISITILRFLDMEEGIVRVKHQGCKLTVDNLTCQSMEVLQKSSQK